MIGSFSQTVSRVPEGKSKLFFITNHDDASEVSPVVQFPGEKAALSAFVLAAALDGSPLIYSSQEIGYPSKVNFINVTVMDWASNTSYTGEYEAAMSVLSLLDRSRGFTSYVSDSTVWIVYDNGLVAVNTTGREVTCAYPSGFSERDESLTFGPYGYFVVFK